MKTKEITMIAAMVTILVVSQFSLQFIVGVNLVFPLLLIYTYNLGFKKGLITMFVFVIVRFVLGMPFLVVFLWAWTFFILVAGSYLVNKISRGNEYVAATFTFLYFIMFGIFASIQEYILTEVPFYAYWIRGLPSDLLGAIAGFVTTLLLLKPISTIITQFLQDFSLQSQN
jgi:hypothetical protein